jgi:uncharacterized phosphosugar-binding protein
MATDRFHDYVTIVREQLETAAERSGPEVDIAAGWIADAIADGRVIYVFGASHAGLLAQDLFYRAGGLVPVEPILPAGLMLNERPVTRTSHLERLSGYARTFMSEIAIGSGDILIVISVSGRNAVAVETCQLAQGQGARVIALTSMTYSSAVTPRGTTRLYEAADLVVDLPVVAGDAVVSVAPGCPRTGPTSTAVGSAILHGLMCEVAGRLADRGLRPPIFTSANLDGSDDENALLLSEYRGRIGYV